MKYELIIKERESGEEVCRKECDCVIAAFAGNIKDGAVAAGTMSTLDGPIYTVITAVNAAQEKIDRAKKLICDNYKEIYGYDITYKELRDFAGAIATTVEANEEAIRAMAKGEVSE